MVVEIIRNGVKFYVHTAWANDTAGTDFSLTEYEEALFVGNYIDRSSAESNLPVKYAWKEIHKVDDENVSATEDGLTDYEERMSDLEASARENADDLAGTQQSTDSAIGNPNLLLNTNNGTANYSTTIGYSIEELVDSIGEGTEYIKCVKVTCNTPSDSGMLFFNADSLRDVLGSAVDENTYTLSMHTRMSPLFDIELIAVQNSDGENQQLVYDVLSNASEDDDVILEDEWVFYESTTQCTEVASDAQMLCMSLANMPAGAYLIIANLKIEAGAIATPWRESVEEVSREVKVIHEKVVVTEAEVKKISGELASFKTGEFENLKAGVAEIEKAYIKAADVNKLLASYATIENLNATNASITTLTAKAITTDNLSAKVGEFGYITAEEVKTNYVSTKTLEADYIKTSELDATVGNFGFLKADSADLTSLLADKVDVNLANIKTAWVEDLMVKGNFVTDNVNAATGSFSKYLTGVKIIGDLIEANTLKAKVLIIEGEDGIFRRLNINALGEAVVNSDPKYNEGLDGSIIVAKSITADQINVTDLFAQTITATGTISGATLKSTHIETISGSIGGFNIGSSYIASANTTALGTTANSVYLGLDGISLGTDFKVTAAGKMTATGAEITGTLNRTKITDNGMEIMDASGNTVARYGTNIIDLGVASADAVINLCGGLGNIKGSTHDSGALSALGINANILKLNATGTTGYLSLNVAKANGYSGSFVLYGAGSDAYADLTLKDGTIYKFRADKLTAPGEIWASYIHSDTDVQMVGDLWVGGDIYGYKFQGPTGGRPTYNGDRIALISDVDNAAAGVDLTGYIKNRGLLGSAVTNANATNIAVGIYTLNNSNVSNLPATGLYGVFFQYPGDHKPQMVIGGTDGVGTIYTRRYLTGSSAWTAWAQMVTTADLSKYALAGHSHSEYALSGHTHSNYAAAGHVHADYALRIHEHTEYAKSDNLDKLSEEIDNHKNDTTSHITNAERTAWNKNTTDLVTLKAQGMQQTPLKPQGNTVAEQLEWLAENGDTTKYYLLKDGYLYEFVGGSGTTMIEEEVLDLSKVMSGTRTNSSNVVATDVTYQLITIPVDTSAISSDITLKVRGVGIYKSSGVTPNMFVRYGEFAQSNLAVGTAAIRGGWVGGTGSYCTNVSDGGFDVKVGYSDETTKISAYDTIRTVTFSALATCDLSGVSIKAVYEGAASAGWSNTGHRFVPATNELVEELADRIGYPVYGTVEDNNTIIVSGNLPSGTYTMKYEDENGNATAIGSFTV